MYWYAAAARPKLFTEYGDKKGYFIQTFLIDDRVNRNSWHVPWESIKMDGDDFIGRPGILKPDYDHTYSQTYREGLRIQEEFRVANIIDVIYDNATNTAYQVSETDRDTYKKVERGEIAFVSPAIWPRSTEDIRVTRNSDGTHTHSVLRFRALHYAFVNDPAYGKGRAKVLNLCEGSADQCRFMVQKAAAVDEADQSFVTRMPILARAKCGTMRYVAVPDSAAQKPGLSGEMCGGDTVAGLSARISVLSVRQRILAASMKPYSAGRFRPDPNA